MTVMYFEKLLTFWFSILSTDSLGFLTEKKRDAAEVNVLTVKTC